MCSINSFMFCENGIVVYMCQRMSLRQCKRTNVKDMSVNEMLQYNLWVAFAPKRCFQYYFLFLTYLQIKIQVMLTKNFMFRIPFTGNKAMILRHMFKQFLF